MLFTNSTHALLPICIGVSDCGRPISLRVCLVILVCWVLQNSAANSASAHNEVTNFYNDTDIVKVSIENDWFAVFGYAS